MTDDTSDRNALITDMLVGSLELQEKASLPVFSVRYMLFKDRVTSQKVWRCEPMKALRMRGMVLTVKWH